MSVNNVNIYNPNKIERLLSGKNYKKLINSGETNNSVENNYELNENSEDNNVKNEI